MGWTQSSFYGSLLIYICYYLLPSLAGQCKTCWAAFGMADAGHCGNIQDVTVFSGASLLAAAHPLLLHRWEAELKGDM